MNNKKNETGTLHIKGTGTGMVTGNIKRKGTDNIKGSETGTGMDKINRTGTETDISVIALTKSYLVNLLNSCLTLL